MNPSIKVILFDLGNTLIYFDDDWLDVRAEARWAAFLYLRQNGLALDEQRFLQKLHNQLNNYYLQREHDLIEHTTEKILRRVLAELEYPDLPAALIRGTLNAMYRISQCHWISEDDAIPTLDALCRKGYSLGLISNAADDWDVQEQIDKAGLRPFLDVIVTSAKFGLRKPHPAIFLAALDHWGVTSSQAAMVGDTLRADVLGAKNLGIYSIWITRRADSLSNREYKSRITPDAAIETLGELLSLIENRESKSEDRETK